MLSRQKSGVSPRVFDFGSCHWVAEQFRLGKGLSGVKCVLGKRAVGCSQGSSGLPRELIRDTDESQGARALAAQVHLTTRPPFPRSALISGPASHIASTVTASVSRSVGSIVSPTVKVCLLVGWVRADGSRLTWIKDRILHEHRECGELVLGCPRSEPDAGVQH
jgi:hypothetical protein